MRKHVMAAMVMKQIDDINMATGEIVKVDPDGVIERWHMMPSEYNQYPKTLPNGWEEFLAIRKMIIPADSWRIYPRFKWVWIDKNYNIQSEYINDTSWRVSDDVYCAAYYGTVCALIGDLRRSGKLHDLMGHVYRHSIGVYTSWSGDHNLTITHNGKRICLGSTWLGDFLIKKAADQANVPDGRFYVVKCENKQLGQLLDNIKSGDAYSAYWGPRDADEALGKSI